METEDLSLTVSNLVRKKFFNGQRIGPIFDSLGIPRKQNGGTFWLDNEAELEYLYDDFCKASRSVLKELHPDVGGDTDEFADFSQIVASIKKSFWNKGIGKDITLFNALEKETKSEKSERYQHKTDRRDYNRILRGLDGFERPKSLNGRNGNSHHVNVILNAENEIIDLEHKKLKRNFTPESLAKYHKRDLQIAKLLLEGLTSGEIQKQETVSNFYINDVIKRLKNKLPDCACGRPRKHSGMCFVRDAKSPARQNFLKNILPQINRDKYNFRKGVSQTKEHREKRSQALKGRKISQEAIFKTVRSRIIKDNYKMSEENKRKLSLRWKGTKKSPEWCEAQSKRLKGKKPSKEQIEKYKITRRKTLEKHFDDKCEKVLQGVRELLALNQYPSTQLLVAKTNFSKNSIQRYRKILKKKELWPVSSEMYFKLNKEPVIRDEKGQYISFENFENKEKITFDNFSKDNNICVQT